MSLVETLAQDVQKAVEEAYTKGDFNIASLIQIGSRLAIKLTQEVALKGAEKKEALLQAVDAGVSAAEAALLSAAKEESAMEVVKKVFGELKPHVRPAVSGALDFAFAVQKGTISLAAAKAEAKKEVEKVATSVLERVRSLLPSLPQAVLTRFALPQICPPKKTAASAPETKDAPAPPAESSPESAPPASESAPAISIREVEPDTVLVIESKTEPTPEAAPVAPHEYTGPAPTD